MTANLPRKLPADATVVDIIAGIALPRTLPGLPVAMTGAVATANGDVLGKLDVLVARVADRQGCLDDLKATLDRLGIEPLGMAPVNGVYTDHVTVPAPDAEEEFVEEVAVAEPPPAPAATPAQQPLAAAQARAFCD
jgi:hypothetical protein